MYKERQHPQPPHYQVNKKQQVTYATASNHHHPITSCHRGRSQWNLPVRSGRGHPVLPSVGSLKKSDLWRTLRSWHGYGVLLVFNDIMTASAASDMPGSPARRPKRGAAWSPYRGAETNAWGMNQYWWGFCWKFWTRFPNTTSNNSNISLEIGHLHLFPTFLKFHRCLLGWLPPGCAAHCRSNSAQDEVRQKRDFWHVAFWHDLPIASPS